jgi:hypothetical protein
MISQSLRIMLLVGLLIAVVAPAGTMTSTAISQRQPMPCGPDCSP